MCPLLLASFSSGVAVVSSLPLLLHEKCVRGLMILLCYVSHAGRHQLPNGRHAKRRGRDPGHVHPLADGHHRRRRLDCLSLCVCSVSSPLAVRPLSAQSIDSPAFRPRAVLYFLFDQIHDTARTQTLVDRLVVLTFSTLVPPLLCTVSVLIIFLKLPYSSIYVALLSIQGPFLHSPLSSSCSPHVERPLTSSLVSRWNSGKLYSMSLLHTLNMSVTKTAGRRTAPCLFSVASTDATSLLLPHLLLLHQALKPPRRPPRTQEPRDRHRQDDDLFLPSILLLFTPQTSWWWRRRRRAFRSGTGQSFFFASLSLYLSL